MNKSRRNRSFNTSLRNNKSFNTSRNTSLRGPTRPRFNLKGKTFIIAASGNGLNYYNHYTGEKFYRAERVHRKAVTCVQQFGTRYLLTAGNNTIKIHSLYPSPSEMKMFQNAHDDDIWSFCTFSPNFFLSGSKDKTVKLWKFDTENCLHVFSSHHGAVNSIARVSTGQFASASEDCTIQYCDLRNNTVIASLAEHRNNVKSLSYDPIRGVLLSGSWDGTARIWDIRTKFRSVSIFKHEELSLVNAVRYFPKYYFLSGDTLGWTRAWDLRKPSKPVRSSNDHKQSSIECIIACQERYGTCGPDRNLRISDFRTGDLKVLLEDENDVFSMCFCNCVQDGVAGGRVMGKKAKNLLKKREIFEEISKIRFEWTPKEDKVTKLSNMVEKLRKRCKRSGELIKRYKKAVKVLKEENLRLERMVRAVAREARGRDREGNRSRIYANELEEKYEDLQETSIGKDRILEMKDKQIHDLRLVVEELKKEKVEWKKIKDDRQGGVTHTPLLLDEEELDNDIFEEVDVIRSNEIRKPMLEIDDEILGQEGKDNDDDDDILLDDDINDIMNSVHKWKDKSVDGEELYYDSSDEEKGGEIVAMDIRKKIEERNKRVMQILKDRKINIE